MSLLGTVPNQAAESSSKGHPTAPPWVLPLPIEKPCRAQRELGAGVRGQGWGGGRSGSWASAFFSSEN